MSGWSRIWAGIQNVAYKRRAESELDAEVRACAEMLADEKMADGMPAAEARRRALVELGGAEQVKQAVRDERAGAGVETFMAGHSVWITATAPFARLRSHGAADHRDWAWGNDGNVQHRLCRNPEASALCASRTGWWRWGLNPGDISACRRWRIGRKAARPLESIAAYTGWAPRIESSAGLGHAQCAAGVAEFFGHAGHSLAVGTGFHAFRQRERLLQPGDCDRWLLAADGRRQCAGWPHDPARLPNLHHHRSFDASAGLEDMDALGQPSILTPIGCDTSEAVPIAGATAPSRESRDSSLGSRYQPRLRIS